MTFQEESKVPECTECTNGSDCPHSQYQFNVNVFQGRQQQQQQEDEGSSSSWTNDVLIDEEQDMISDTNTEEEGQDLPIVVRSTSPTSIMDDDDDEQHQHSQQHSQSQQSSQSTNTITISTLHRSVSWKEEIVTDVIYRPKTHSSDKRGLYYNSADMQRFRQHYKMQVRAAQDYQKRVRNDANAAAKTNGTIQHRDAQHQPVATGEKVVVASSSSSGSVNSCTRTGTQSHSRSNSISKKRAVPNVTKKQQQHQHQHHLYTSPITGLINRMTGYLAKTSSSLPSTSSNSTSSNNTYVSIGPAVADTCVLVDTLYLF